MSNHQSKGNFDPWKMVGEIADDLTKDLFDKIVDEEVNDTCDHVVKQVINIK